jgi:hypothetical protein
MARDPLEDLASSVRGAKGISPADQWNSVSQVISSALLEASEVLQNQGGIDAFVDSLDGLNGAGGVILAVVHQGRRPALIFRPSSSGVEVVYAATIEVPAGSSKWGLAGQESVENSWGFDQVTRDNVINVVNFFVRATGVIS